MTSPADTVAQAFAQSAARFGARPFLAVLPETAAIYGVAAGETSYAQAQEKIAKLRAAYAAAGYGHGHRVGLLLENRPAFLLHWFALNGLGVSGGADQRRLRSAELEYLIGHARSRWPLHLPQRQTDLRSAARGGRRPHAPWWPADDAPPRAPSPAPLRPSRSARGTECALLYTSGTTGRPRAACCSNEYFLRAGAVVRGLGGVCAVRPAMPSACITPLPLNHMNAMAFSTMAMLLAGGCLVQLDRFHPKKLVAQRARQPRHHRALPGRDAGDAAVGAGERRTIARTSVRFGFGAGVDRKNHAIVRAALRLSAGGGLGDDRDRRRRLRHGQPRAAPRRHAAASAGARGRRREAAWSTSGAQADVDEPGELLVRHAGADPRGCFFAGYLKDAEATDEAWAGGWFHTGDMVRRDADGQLHFIDRKKNVIRRSGENISAVEVESVLHQHPRGEGGRRWRPCPMRCAATRCWPASCCASRCRRRRAAKPRASIVQRAWRGWPTTRRRATWRSSMTLPLTPSQKIQRGELRGLARRCRRSRIASTRAP